MGGGAQGEAARGGRLRGGVAGLQLDVHASAGGGASLTCAKRSSAESTTRSPRGALGCAAEPSDGRVSVHGPMRATGGSVATALNQRKRAGARQLELVCLVSAPQGIEAVKTEHPDVTIWTAAVDRELDENAYIRPGLGDA